ncbi:MAG TPA: hypothetical protein VHC90_20500 [Bryobacteraceae bacterium]|nr:hypothetical protein [Bryobacteraceae bacterium]
MSEQAQHGMHPDVDVLGAFAEGALTEHERLECLDHLASCAQCREIVYLTQVAEAADAAPALKPAPEIMPFWKRWLTPLPMLSSAAVAALLAVSIAVYRHQTAPPPPRPELMAKVETPAAHIPAPAQPKAAKPAQTRLEAPKSQAVRPKAARPMDVPRQQNLVVPPPRAVTPPTPLAQTAPFSPAVAQSFTPSTATPVVPAAIGALNVESAPLNPQPQEPLKAVSGQSTPDSLVVNGTVSAGAAFATNAAAQGGGGGGRGGRGGAAGLTFRSAMAAPPPLPSAASGKIQLKADATGALLRSTNSGKSWKTVKARWQGKVIRLVTPPDAPGAAKAVFQLNTDTGEIWLSRDGNRWNAAPAH